MPIARRLAAPVILASLLTPLLVSATQPPPQPAPSHSAFDGEILAVLYVSDVRRSVAYYADVLGFRFDHYYDHHDGGSVATWAYDDEPVYAEMWAGPTRFALHKASTDYEKTVGGAIYYFGVTDVHAHYAAIKKRGGGPTDLVERPWMTMFSITDPDGHRLFFQTRPKNE